MKLEWRPTEPKQMTWQEAMDFAASLVDGWRLPTAQELFSLVDLSKMDPASSDPDMKSTYYWSSTTYPSNPAYAWSVYFYSGFVSSDYKTYNGCMRCVREVEE